MPKLRITNITSFLQPPGFGLDFEGKYIPPNPTRPLIIEIPVEPQILEEWKEKRWVKVQDADDKTPVTKEAEAVVTKSMLGEAKASEVQELNDDLDEDIVDFAFAKEAALPGDLPEKGGPAPLQAINQMENETEKQARAKVTIGTSGRPSMADSVSPIPGDRPVSVDKSEAFTVRAPRHNGPGAVVKGS